MSKNIFEELRLLEESKETEKAEKEVLDADAEDEENFIQTLPILDAIDSDIDNGDFGDDELDDINLDYVEDKDLEELED